MSENEVNLTPTERKILKGLNVKAALILQAQETLQSAKIPMNPDVLYSLDEQTLVDLIETWDPKNQAILKKKHTRSETKNDN